MPAEIKVKFEDMATLHTLPKQLLDSAFEELLNQAYLMQGYAQVYVNVETGALRDSIRVERGGEGSAWKRVRVRAGGYIVNPKTNRLVDYAAYVETKYHFMAQAWNQVRDNITSILQRHVPSRINP